MQSTIVTTLKFLQVLGQAFLPATTGVDPSIKTLDEAVAYVKTKIDGRADLKTIKKQIILGVLEKTDRRGQISQSVLDDYIKKAHFQFLCKNDTTLLPLPRSGFGKMSEQEIFNDLFYVKSIYQNDCWSCGWRSFLAALKLETNLKNGGAINANSSVPSGLTIEHFPAKSRKIVEPELNKIGTLSGSDHVASSVNVCMRYLKRLYHDPAYTESVLEYPKEFPPRSEMPEDWAKGEAQGCHLVDLAKEFGLTNFYVIGAKDTSIIPMIAFYQSDWPLLARAYSKLLECQNRACFEKWKESYDNFFNKLQTTLQNCDQAGEFRDECEELVKENALEDCVINLVNRGSLLKEMREKNKKSREENSKHKANYADFINGTSEEIFKNKDLVRDALKAISKNKRLMFDSHLMALNRAYEELELDRKYFERHQRAWDEVYRSHSYKVCQLVPDNGKDSLNESKNDNEKLLKIFERRKKLFKDEMSVLFKSYNDIKQYRSYFEKHLKALEAACYSDSKLLNTLIGEYNAKVDLFNSKENVGEKVKKIFEKRRGEFTYEMEMLKPHLKEVEQYNAYFNEFEAVLQTAYNAQPDQSNRLIEDYKQLVKIKDADAQQEKIKKILKQKEKAFDYERKVFDPWYSYTSFFDDIEALGMVCKSDPLLLNRLTEEYNLLNDSKDNNFSERKRKIFATEFEIFRKSKLLQWIKNHHDDDWIRSFMIEHARTRFQEECINPNKPGAIHFAVNVPGHWILVSVVKGEKGKPFILIQDSFNGQLNQLGRNSIAFIHTRFIRPFLNEDKNALLSK